MKKKAAPFKKNRKKQVLTNVCFFLLLFYKITLHQFSPVVGGQHGVNLIVDSVVFFSFNGGFICSHQSRFFHQQTPQKNLIFVREKKGSSKKWPDSIHLSGGTFHKSFAFQIFFKVHSAVEKAKNSIFFKVQEKGFFFC